MAWTAPMTWTAHAVITAAQLNEQLRDNLLETLPAKANEAGQYFVSAGLNSIAARKAVSARLDTGETTTSTTYTDLATVGPSVTADCGTSALVFVYCNVDNDTNAQGTYMSWAMTGATDRAAIDSTALKRDGMNATNSWGLSMVDMLSDINPGLTTFTAQYKVDAGLGWFGDRTIIVMPL